MIKPQTIIAQIRKNLKNKNWNCLAYDCKEIAINSHLIQQNGLLSNISKNGHLVELKFTDLHKWDKNTSPFNFQLVGIKHALSFKIFCNKHDTEIFKSIESNETDFENYEAFLLFSYRAVCCEIRKKEIAIEQYSRILGANSLIAKINIEMIKLSMDGNTHGITDLKKIKEEFEIELKSNQNKFSYFIYKYPKFEIYASAIFSANEINMEDDIKNPDLENIYIHFLPLKDTFLLIIGYHNDYTSERTIEYCKSWENLSLEELQKKITELLVTNIENWGLSRDLNDKISNTNRNLYLKTLIDNQNQFGISNNMNFNLFC